MTKKLAWVLLGVTAVAAVLGAQQSDIFGIITKGERAAIAIPDFREPALPLP